MDTVPECLTLLEVGDVKNQTGCMLEAHPCRIQEISSQYQRLEAVVVTEGTLCLEQQSQEKKYWYRIRAPAP